ncbi:homeobox protein Hox-A11 isoform X2 [Melanerpes formicivorus]|uniref:homeobox protein Hox-A11 isoform X2 n=1 Tax=Melanerpes formicivorus TaxID=211600 RepID=UPI00358F3E16
MMDFDERVPCSSNMYLPSCTYYVSGPDFSSLPSFLPQTPSSRPMTYSYSSNLPQVQPVREVTFREYAIDPSSKWHPRNNLPHCYSAEEIMHRDCLPATNTASMGEMFGKNTANVYHPSTNVSSNFYSTVGRNGVLPQAFDQFFETAYGTAENLSSADYPVDKNGEKAPAAAGAAAAATSSSEGGCGRAAAAAAEKERRRRPESSSSPESSSGNNEEKSGSSSTADHPATAFGRHRRGRHISVPGLAHPRPSLAPVLLRNSCLETARSSSPKQDYCRIGTLRNNLLSFLRGKYLG